MPSDHKYNRLINASSPYLLQHAANPVDWHEWGEEAWSKARAEDKPVLVSIGYASCHWCHVMERETFENPDSAAIMNEFFVCIKVDREERPDVDQVYMDAIQLISGQGGWPLNMFCMPDGRPIHGGTYFPNPNWNQLLFQIRDLFLNRRKEAEEYADKLKEGLGKMDLLKAEGDSAIDKHVLAQVFTSWQKQFDLKDGGMARTPKFPLPNNYQFLLNYGLLADDQDAKEFVHFTMKKQLQGGIYDQIQGGFARYSVDAYWLVPHFEKMLYDNAQLVSLLSKAYQDQNFAHYEITIRQTIQFMEDEWQLEPGVFASSFDADSEGEEGKYYVWTVDELDSILGKDSALIKDYYNCTPTGNWEEGKNILNTSFLPSEFAALHKLEKEAFEDTLKQAQGKLLAERNKRVKPGLDHKYILAWNALLLEAYCDAYQALGDEHYLEQAQTMARFIREHMIRDGKLYRIYKDEKVSIPGFLEDKAQYCSALIALYQVDFDERHLLEAKKIAESIIEHHVDPNNRLLYFTDPENDLILRKKDLTDDVISSANSVMALCFKKLYFYFSEPRFKEQSDAMNEAVAAQFEKYAPWYSNWGQSYLLQAYGTYQLCAVKKALKDVSYQPNLLLAQTKGKSRLPLLEEKLGAEPAYYLCQDETCFAPAESIQEALKNKA